jgi:hypothetical protein
MHADFLSFARTFTSCPAATADTAFRRPVAHPRIVAQIGRDGRAGVFRQQRPQGHLPRPGPQRDRIRRRAGLDETDDFVGSGVDVRSARTTQGYD